MQNFHRRDHIHETENSDKNLFCKIEEAKNIAAQMMKTVSSRKEKTVSSRKEKTVSSRKEKSGPIEGMTRQNIKNI